MMKRTREEKKAELRALADEVIDELVEWEEENEKPTLTQIEDIVLKLRKRLGKRMAEMIVEEQETVEPVPGPECPECGEEMEYKGLKGNRVESRVGGLDMERGYYYCRKCGKGIFPPGQATGVEGEELE